MSKSLDFGVLLTVGFSLFVSILVHICMYVLENVIYFLLRSESIVRDYYKVLKINYDATDEKIKLNYRRLALKWPLHKHKGDNAVTVKFKLINEAYKR
ncbi:unnamed protein product, partial [Vitis vinifera]